MGNFVGKIRLTGNGEFCYFYGINPLPMIYEVKRLTVDELQQLYIMESNRLMEGVALKFSHNSLQSLRLNVFHLDQELRRRKSTYRLHRA